ncbi:MAG: class I SAM-dependent methyltransferase [Polynucleobacter sp.]|nr:class I SAM-dependent methyltransferase [Polynucleobacter sp.]
MNCRHCGSPLIHTFLNLGFAPPSNAYLTKDGLSKPEKYYPLKIKVCQKCWLVQTEDYADAGELFNPEYAYFSSTSSGWLNHAKLYSEQIIECLGLNSDSFVVEVASNDGYLLKNFIAAHIPCLGIEPTASTAAVAKKLGIPVLKDFFGEALGRHLSNQGKKADLIIGNNVYAHVPDINDFTRGIKALLKPRGVVTLEFPHLMRMLEGNQFDTAYHEHFSYLSFFTVNQIFIAAGLRLWKVEELNTHGGSLRIYGCHTEDGRETHSSVSTMLNEEAKRNLQNLKSYVDFQSQANRIKNDLLSFLIEQKRAEKKVMAYGAAAKGNTLLNYAGVKPDLLPYVCDAATAKQGKFMPGSHIPIMHPDFIATDRPDYILILPWNITEEIQQQYQNLKDSGIRFVTAVPKLTIL